MERRRASLAKRRTTLTLPGDALAEAQRVARARHTTLSAVIADALTQGLESNRASERASRVLKDYRQAFEGFSAEECLILDGVIPERPSKR